MGAHTPATLPVDSLRALLTELIDYAGLFPPAKLPMSAAVRNYATYLRSDHAFALGRFICPVSRLAEFDSAAEELLPGANGRTASTSRTSPLLRPWRLSAISDGDLAADLSAVEAFNRRHEDPHAGIALIDAIEIKAPSPFSLAHLDVLLELIPDDVYPFFEFPASADPRGLISSLSGAGAAAKFRTGGVTPDAFPAPAQIVAFISACAAADVPFKATAGLHHPVRAEQNLTYEKNCPRAVMHGFLNVFMAAFLLRSRVVDAAVATAIIEETDPAAFTFSPTHAAWRDRAVSADAIAQHRERFALSYGSCSVQEPVEDLRALGLL